MMKGTVVRITDRGYGFIKPDEGDKDVFFHAHSLVSATFDDLREGDAVTFEIEEGDKGPSATNVELAGEAAPEAPAEEAPETPEAA